MDNPSWHSGTRSDILPHVFKVTPSLENSLSLKKEPISLFKQDSSSSAPEHDSIVAFSSIVHKVPPELRLEILSRVDPLVLPAIGKSRELYQFLVRNFTNLVLMMKRRQIAHEVTVFPSDWLSGIECLYTYPHWINSFPYASASMNEHFLYVMKLHHLKKLSQLATQAIQLGFPSMLQTDLIKRQITILWRFLSPLSWEDGGPSVCFEEQLSEATGSELENFLANFMYEYLAHHPNIYPDQCYHTHSPPGRNRQGWQWRFTARLERELAFIGLPQILTKQFLLVQLVKLLEQLWNDGEPLAPYQQAMVLEHFQMESSIMGGDSEHASVFMHRSAETPFSPLAFSVAGPGATYTVIISGTRKSGLIDLIIPEEMDYRAMLEKSNSIGRHLFQRYDFWNMWHWEGDFGLEAFFGEE